MVYDLFTLTRGVRPNMIEKTEQFLARYVLNIPPIHGVDGPQIARRLAFALATMVEVSCSSDINEMIIYFQTLSMDLVPEAITRLVVMRFHSGDEVASGLQEYLRVMLTALEEGRVSWMYDDTIIVARARAQQQQQQTQQSQQGQSYQQTNQQPNQQQQQQSTGGSVPPPGAQTSSPPPHPPQSAQRDSYDAVSSTPAERAVVRSDARSTQIFDSKDFAIIEAAFDRNFAALLAHDSVPPLRFVRDALYAQALREFAERCTRIPSFTAEEVLARFRERQVAISPEQLLLLNTGHRSFICALSMLVSGPEGQLIYDRVMAMLLADPATSKGEFISYPEGKALRRSNALVLRLGPNQRTSWYSTSNRNSNSNSNSNSNNNNNNSTNSNRGHGNRGGRGRGGNQANESSTTPSAFGGNGPGVTSADDGPCFQGTINNVAIDGVLQRLSIPAMSTSWTYMAARGDATAIRAVKTFARRNTTVLLPLCAEHHWVCVFFVRSSLVVMDSHPLTTTQTVIHRLASSLAQSRTKKVPVRYIEVPKQVGSECGLHLLLNIIIFYETKLAPPAYQAQAPSLQLLAPWFQAFAHGSVSRRILTHLCRAFLRLHGDNRLPPITFSNLSKTVNDGDPLLIVFAGRTESTQLQRIQVQRRGRSDISLVLSDGRRFPHSEVTIHAIIPVGTIFDEQLPVWQALGPASTGLEESLPLTTVSKPGRQPVQPKPYPLPIPRSQQQSSEPWVKNYEDLLAGNVRVPFSVRQEMGDQISLASFDRFLQASTPPTISSLMLDGLARCTQEAHQQNLRWLRNHYTNLLNSTPNITLDMALPLLIESMERERNWAPTSTLTRLTSIQGALKILPLYREGAPSILLKACPRWLMALKGAQTRALMHPPQQPCPISPSEARQAWVSTTGPLAAAIEMAWCTAGRVGDVLQLKSGNVALQPHNMAVALRAGKTARKGGYGISVPLPSASLQQYIRRQPNGQWLFPGVTGEQVRLALRKINPALEQRSLRRGRLQFLASKQLPDAELLQLSRHGTVQMLRRYLDMGLKSADNARNAGRILEAEIRQ